MNYNSESLEIIDIGTLCTLLNISRNTAYTLLTDTPDPNKITAWRVGNRWKCTRAAVDEYIMRQSHFYKQA